MSDFISIILEINAVLAGCNWKNALDIVSKHQCMGILNR